MRCLTRPRKQCYVQSVQLRVPKRCQPISRADKKPVSTYNELFRNISARRSTSRLLLRSKLNIVLSTKPPGVLRSATNAHHFLCMVRDGVAIKGDSVSKTKLSKLTVPNEGLQSLHPCKMFKFPNPASRIPHTLLQWAP